MAQVLNFKELYDGLSAAQVEQQLEMYGLNGAVLDEDKHYSVRKAILRPQFFVFLTAAVLEFVSGSVLGGTVMVLLAAIYTVLDIITQSKHHERYFSFKRLGGTKVRVVRDGALTLVRREYVVPDDIIVLQAGERVPADAHLLESDGLTVDEYIFTGLHSPVGKKPGADSKRSAPKATCVYNGTVVLSGSLIARVFATGEDVAKYTAPEKDVTAFEKSIGKITRYFGIAAALLAAIAAVVLIIGGAIEPTVVENSLESPQAPTVFEIISRVVIPALGAGLCLLPGGACSVARLYYLQGAARLNRGHALAKRLKTIENMGALTCVCVEKSGTITKNHLEVSDVYSDNRELFMNVCVLACEPSLTAPLEKAIMVYATFAGIDVKDLQDNKRIKSYPFSENGRLAGELWEINGNPLLCVKGSPEEVMSLCDMDLTELRTIRQKQSSCNRMGQQVLAVAFAAPKKGDVPQNLSSARLTFIGLIALENQTKDTIPYAVKSCYRAGVDVIMTTGDSEETAAAIARKIGLREGGIITGPVLEDMIESGQRPDITGVNIFARVNPKQRLTILRLLQENGEIVAIEGDDTDDLELLEAADVGIAVNSEAVPAAVESCDLLMSDGNFIAVSEAVRESRQIHRNVKNAISVMLAGYVALALVVIAILLTGGASALTPVFGALAASFLIPACSLVFLENTADLKSDFISSGFIARGKINRRFLPRAFISGLTLGAAMMLFYFFSMDLVTLNGGGALRAMLLLMFGIGLILTAFTKLSSGRTFISVMKEKKSTLGFFAAGIILLTLLIIIFVPFLNSAFSFSAPSLLAALVAVVLTVPFTIWQDVLKLFYADGKK